MDVGSRTRPSTECERFVTSPDFMSLRTLTWRALSGPIIILPNIVCGVRRGSFFRPTVPVTQPSETITVIGNVALTSERASTKCSPLPGQRIRAALSAVPFLYHERQSSAHTVVSTILSTWFKKSSTAFHLGEKECMFSVCQRSQNLSM